MTDNQNQTKAQVPARLLEYIEGELEMYPAYQAALEGLRREQARVAADTGVTARVRMSALEDKLELNRLRLRRIEVGLGVLDPEEAELVRLRYCNGGETTNEQVMRELAMNRKRFYQLRGQALAKLAGMFGMG